jgi:Phytochelatin synthase
MNRFSKYRRSLDSIFLAFLLSTLICSDSAWALARLSKFGPYATPMSEQTEFLRRTPAFDYWKLSQYYLPQQTSSACGLASVTMALNFLKGLPRFSDQTLVTQTSLLETVFTGDWAEKVAENGDGLKFDELVTLVNYGLRFYNLRNYSIEVIRPQNTPAGLNQIKQVLAANENSPNDLVLAYFNQGVLTSDWDGPHISPIGAYDPINQRVLIMDVDRDWYVPYWSSISKFQEALIRPAPIDQGILAGQIGGLIHIKPIR